MIKKLAILGGTLALLVALAACSAIQSITGATSGQAQASANGGAAQNGQQGQGNGRGFGGDPTKMTVEQKLGIGILKLEGTPQALTADEAKTILPLWQALKSMQTSNNASVDEINALFTQTKEALTPDQVTAIQKLTWTQTDMQALMQQYNIGFGGNGQGGAQGTPDATRIAQFRAQGGGAGGGGGFGGGGGGGGFGGAGGTGSGASGATRTPSPQQLNRRAMGLNSVFIDPVIKLLQTKAGG